MVAFSRVCKDMTAAAGPKSVRSTVALEACEDVPSCCSDCVCYIYIYIYIHIHIYIDIYICMIGIYGLCILVVCMYACNAKGIHVPRFRCKKLGRFKCSMLERVSA